MITPQTPVRYIKGIGDARAAAFEKLGIFCAEDLLRFFPRGYQNRGRIIPIASTIDGEECSVLVTVCDTSLPQKTKNGLTVVRSVVRDDSSNLELVFFNNPYIHKTLVTGKKFRVFGRIKHGLYGREMVAPKLEAVIPGKQLKNLVPIYRLTPPLTQKIISDAVEQVLPLCNAKGHVIPTSAVNRHGLMEYGQAVRQLHFPTDEETLARARRTLAFEELLVFQLALSGLRCTQTKERANPLTLKGCGIARFFESLPYDLTGAQKRAVKDIVSDMEKPYPMARLVQGDVGSGKTAVAASAIFLCVKNGFQACMMAPTEILARQHKKTLESMLSPFGINVGLLVSGLPSKEKRLVRQGLADGKIQVAVGTHALITDTTVFQNLALAVTDEQHRFGVAQRAKILDKSQNHDVRAHMLVMSATPIPRSLSLIIYGDLDVSVLDELPPGRRPVETRAVRESQLKNVYDYIKKEISDGGQAYIVCPLVEDSETVDRKAAESHFEHLSKTVFSNIPMGLIHGKLKPAEKEAAMADFSSGKTKILVSTTVIEVGVDVKNASVMVIENAECFGLSQLHQLRGRIGRGTRSSVCVLVNGSNSPDAAERLRIMVDTPDGFGIAEKDLEKRGPGDFFGERQSGEFGFACASVSDMTLIETTRALAQQIRQDSTNPDFASVLHRAEIFLERTGGAKTVN